jgi:hypothetical protein
MDKKIDIPKQGYPFRLSRAEPKFTYSKVWWFNSYLTLVGEASPPENRKLC